MPEKSMIKAIICGCNGKMGKTITNMMSKREDCEVTGGIDRSCIPNNVFPMYESPIKVNITPDVIIDFSNPSVLTELLEYGQKNHVPLVICTTGFTETQFEQIKEASKFIPIFYSRNMSLGINLLIELTKKTAKILGDEFDIEIIEKHHNQKIDAPSGTALMMAEAVSKAMDEDMEYVYKRDTHHTVRSKNEIGIHSIRAGNMCGDHEIIFSGNDEILTLAHHAGSRDIFARGAIKAAQFLINQDPGFYTMNDLLQF